MKFCNNALLLCFSLIVLEAKAKTVDFIDPCHFKDSACILKSSKKAMLHIVGGLPAYGIESLDPLVIPNDVNGDSGEIKLLFQNMVVRNLKNCLLDNVERPEKLKISLGLECPFLVTGQFRSGGIFFNLNISGHGDFEFRTENMKMFIKLNLNPIEKDGIGYYKVSSFDFSYEPDKKVYLDFKHHSEENAATHKAVKELLDSSWKEVMSSFAKPVVKEMIKVTISKLSKLLSKVPRTELELD